MSVQALEFTRKIEADFLYQAILHLEEELLAMKKVLVAVMPKIKSKALNWDKLCQWGKSWREKKGLSEDDIMEAVYESRYQK